MRFESCPRISFAPAWRFNPVVIVLASYSSTTIGKLAMTTCSNSETILATSSPATSASTADVKAAEPTIDKPAIEVPKLDAPAAAPGPENSPHGRAKINPPLDASSLKALSAVAAIVEAPAREATVAPAVPLLADGPPLSPRQRDASVAAATPVATARKQSSRFTLVAASVVFAAGIGATLAALAMSGFPWPVS